MSLQSNKVQQSRQELNLLNSCRDWCSAMLTFKRASNGSEATSSEELLADRKSSVSDINAASSSSSINQAVQAIVYQYLSEGRV